MTLMAPTRGFIYEYLLIAYLPSKASIMFVESRDLPRD